MIVFFTTLMATFNRLEVTKRAIRSYAAQTYPTHLRELIVIDDNSTDGSYEKLVEWIALQRFNFDVKVVQTPTNGGPGPARNYGATQAKAVTEHEGTMHYFTVLDSDDEYAPGYLTTRAQTIVKWEGYPYFYGGILVKFGSKSVPDPHEPSRQIPISETSQGPTMVILASLFTSLGGYRAMFGADGDLMGRVESAGITPYKIVVQDYLYYRDSEDALAKHPEKATPKG